MNVCLHIGKLNFIPNRSKKRENTIETYYLITNSFNKDNKVKCKTIFNAKIRSFLNMIFPCFSMKSTIKYNLKKGN